MDKVTFDYCVYKCRQSEICEFATWEKSSTYLGHCQLSKADCASEDTHDLKFKLWQKSKFLNLL